MADLGENNLQKWFWLPHEDLAFIPAKLIDEKGDKSILETYEEEEIVQYPTKHLKKLQIAQPSSLPGTMANLVQLQEFSQGAIVHQLRGRYETDMIYTNIGTILISINPYKLLPIYSNKILNHYHNRPPDKHLPPHIFEIASNAFQGLMRDGVNQSVIISGESGAGKTEATKLILQFLSEVAGSETQVEQAILESNPLLEAFGNAKTLRNNNSSRFGKWMEITFDGDRISGCRLQNYLLEKSRVVYQTAGERSFHSFYFMLAGLSGDEQLQLKLEGPEQYTYLNQSGCLDVDGINDSTQFTAMKRAFEELGLENSEIMDIYRTIASVLQLGNCDPADNPDPKKEGAVISNPEQVDVSAEVLQVDNKDLLKALTFKTITVVGEVSFIPLKKDEAVNARDALAKAIYTKFFDWLIQRINLSLDRSKSRQTIGVLDIFGFETFDENLFEQMCINYANEKLQQHFNKHIFKMEQEEYKTEGIDIAHIEFIDNQDCLDMVEQNRTGIFAMLEEQVQMPGGNDRDFVEALHRTFDQRLRHKNYARIRHTPNIFIIIHYAAKVPYNSDGMVEKNSDKLHDLAQQLMVSSDCKLLKDIFEGNLPGKPKKVAEPAAKKGRGGRSKKKKVSTLSSAFKGQLNHLMSTLDVTEPHFVRCIKPNSEKAADDFDAHMVLSQLRYSGLFEAIRIRKSGFSFRKGLDAFLNRYRVLLPLEIKKKSHMGKPARCRAVIDQIKGKIKEVDIQIGKNKVFFRAQPLEVLELARDVALTGICIKIQKVARGFLARRLFRRLKKVNDALKSASDSRNLVDLKEALELAEHQGFRSYHLGIALKLQKELEEEIRVCGLLQEAAASMSLDAIEGALEQAEKINLVTVCKDEDILKALKDAVSTRDLLIRRMAARKALKEAVEDEDLKQLETAIKECEESGIPAQDLAKPKELLETLIAQEKIMEDLRTATANKNIPEIEKGLELAQTVPMDPQRTENVRSAHKVYVAHYKDALTDAMESGDQKLVQAALFEVQTRKLQDEMLETMSAVEEFYRQVQIKELKDKLEAAMGASNVDELKNLVAEAKRKGFTQDLSMTLGQADEFFYREEIKEYQDKFNGLIASRDISKLKELIHEIEQKGDRYVSDVTVEIAGANRVLYEEEVKRYQEQIKEAIADAHEQRVRELLKEVEDKGGDYKTDMAQEFKEAEDFFRLQEAKGHASELTEAISRGDEGSINEKVAQIKALGFGSDTFGELDKANDYLTQQADERERMRIEAEEARQEQLRREEEERKKREEEDRIRLEKEEEERRKEEERLREIERKGAEERAQKEAEEKAQIESEEYERRLREEEVKQQQQPPPVTPLVLGQGPPGAGPGPPSRGPPSPGPRMQPPPSPGQRMQSPPLAPMDTVGSLSSTASSGIAALNFPSTQYESPQPPSATVAGPSSTASSGIRAITTVTELEIGTDSITRTLESPRKFAPPPPRTLESPRRFAPPSQVAPPSNKIQSPPKTLNTRALERAVEERDYEAIKKEIELIKGDNPNLQMVPKIVHKAINVLKSYEDSRSALEQLVDANRSLDRPRIKRALSLYKGLVPEAVNSHVKEARELAYGISDEDLLNKQIGKAVNENDTEKIKILLEVAEQKEMSSPTIDAARNKLFQATQAQDEQNFFATDGGPLTPHKSEAARKKPKQVKAKQQDEKENEDYSKFFNSVKNMYPFHRFKYLRKPGNYAKKHYLAKKEIKKKMLLWQKDPIPRSLVHLSTEYCGGDQIKSIAVKHEARDLFKWILGYMRERYHAYPVTLAYETIIRGCHEPLLRDPIYCQLIKQTTQNPSPESELLGWKLIYLCLSSFDCSQELSMILLSHIALRANPRPKAFTGFSNCEDAAFKCYKQWEVTFKGEGPRKDPPSIEEIQALTDAKPIPLKIYTQDGSFQKIMVPPNADTMTIGDLAREVCKRLGVSGDTSAFEIQVQCDDKNLNRTETIWIPSDLLVFQCISHWEAESKKNTDIRYTLIFRKRGFYESDLFPSHETAGYIRLVYFQAVSDVRLGKFPAELETLSRLAAIQLMVQKKGLPVEKHTIRPATLPGVLPPYSLEKRSFQEWKGSILQNCESLEERTDRANMDRRLVQLYLELIKAVNQYPLFGCTCFFGQLKKPSTSKFKGMRIVLGVNWRGVLVCDKTFKRITLLPLETIENVDFGESESTVSFLATDGDEGSVHEFIYSTHNSPGCFDLISNFVEAQYSTDEEGSDESGESGESGTDTEEAEEDRGYEAKRQGSPQTDISQNGASKSRRPPPPSRVGRLQNPSSLRNGPPQRNGSPGTGQPRQRAGPPPRSDSYSHPRSGGPRSGGPRSGGPRSGGPRSGGPRSPPHPNNMRPNASPLMQRSSSVNRTDLRGRTPPEALAGVRHRPAPHPNAATRPVPPARNNPLAAAQISRPNPPPRGSPVVSPSGGGSGRASMKRKLFKPPDNFSDELPTSGGPMQFKAQVEEKKDRPRGGFHPLDLVKRTSASTATPGGPGLPPPGSTPPPLRPPGGSAPPHLRPPGGSAPPPPGGAPPTPAPGGGLPPPGGGLPPPGGGLPPPGGAAPPPGGAAPPPGGAAPPPGAAPPSGGGAAPPPPGLLASAVKAGPPPAIASVLQQGLGAPKQDNKPAKVVDPRSQLLEALKARRNVVGTHTDKPFTIKREEKKVDENTAVAKAQAALDNQFEKFRKAEAEKSDDDDSSDADWGDSD